MKIMCCKYIRHWIKVKIMSHISNLPWHLSAIDQTSLISVIENLPTPHTQCTICITDNLFPWQSVDNPYHTQRHYFFNMKLKSPFNEKNKCHAWQCLVGYFITYCTKSQQTLIIQRTHHMFPKYTKFWPMYIGASLIWTRWFPEKSSI
jgi:hypothetical protein